MCKAVIDGGIRCDCDNSVARRERRVNAKVHSQYSVLVETPAAPNLLVEEGSDRVYTVEEIKNVIDNLEIFETGLPIKEQLAEYDRRLNFIGAGVNYLAETKYGAPTDEQFVKALETDEKKVLAAVKKEEKAVKALQDIHQGFEDQLYATGINRETHPIMSQRFAAWLEHHPELHKQWTDSSMAQYDANKAFHAKRYNGGWNHLRVSDSLFVKRNEALKLALAEVGVEFADPKTLKISEDSHKDAITSLHEALNYYPQVWVDKSNQNVLESRIPLRIKRSTGRAHYSERKNQNGFTIKTKLHIEDKPEGWKPDPLDEMESAYTPVNADGEYVDPKSGIRHSGSGNVGVKAWAYIHYQHSRGEIKPRGNGWSQYQVYEETYNSETRRFERTGEIVTKWRRPTTSREQSSWNSAAELTVSKDKGNRVSKNKGYRVAMHEFAHRVEHVAPEVKKYEEAFLLRRAGKLDDSVEPDKLTPIYSGRNSEKGYKDNFPTHYMGKVYATGYREILSMGMESLFAGKNGGFVGADGHKADPDYKRFVLGILASSSRKYKPAPKASYDAGVDING